MTLNTKRLVIAALGGAFVIGAFIALSQVQWNIYGVPVIAVMAAVAGGTIFSWVGDMFGGSTPKPDPMHGHTQ